MVIKTQLTEKDFVNVSFLVLYSKRFVKVWLVIMLLSPIMLLLNLTGVIPSAFAGNTDYTQVLLPLVALVLPIILVRYSARKNFKGNTRISEPITYTMDRDMLTLTGESFNSQLTWEKLHKVSLTKNWVLLWNNSQSANPIPRRNMSEHELAELKSILDAHNVKNNL